jgi:hypothetical protein
VSWRLRGNTSEASQRSLSGESRTSSGHDERCSGFGIGNAFNRALEKGPWYFEIAVLCTRESVNHPLLAGWSRRSGARSATESIRGGSDFGNGFSSSQGEGGPLPPARGPRGPCATSDTPQVDPLKLAARIPSSRTESAGANRAGSRQRPQLTLLVHGHCGSRAACHEDLLRA